MDMEAAMNDPTHWAYWETKLDSLKDMSPEEHNTTIRDGLNFDV